MKSGFFAAALVAAALLGQPVQAQKSPEKIKLTASSKNGAVLIRVPVQPFSYALSFSKNGSSGFMSRVYMMKVEEGGASGFRYIARTLAPGRYRLDSIWQQGHWSACLEQGTFEFTIAGGEIAYLGTLRTDDVLAALQGQALQAGQAVQAGTGYFQSHDRAPAPVIDARDETALREAKTFADSSMNGSGELVRLAAVQSTSFGTSGLAKAIKICG